MPPRITVREGVRMADRLTREARSKNMAAIRSSSTTPERTVARYLAALGYRTQRNRKTLPGKPDIVLPDLRSVIFVHGCFWHQHGPCADSRLPRSNLAYWLPKLAANKRRDERNTRRLRRAGWHVFVIWDCQATQQQLPRLARRVARLPHRPTNGTRGVGKRLTPRPQ
jgi:DNA mismatch endonuclease (patch repair protein)